MKQKNLKTEIIGLENFKIYKDLYKALLDDCEKDSNV